MKSLVYDKSTKTFAEKFTSASYIDLDSIMTSTDYKEKYTKSYLLKSKKLKLLFNWIEMNIPTKFSGMKLVNYLSGVRGVDPIEFTEEQLGKFNDHTRSSILSTYGLLIDLNICKDLSGLATGISGEYLYLDLSSRMARGSDDTTKELLEIYYSIHSANKEEDRKKRVLTTK